MMLHLYFARRFATTLAAMFGLFFCFLGMIDFIDQIRRFSGDVGFTEILWLSLLKLPNALYVMLPLIVILAAIALFVALSRSSELIVTRASGRSAIYSLMAPVLVAGILGFFAVAIGNPIVAATSKRYQELSETYRNNGVSAVSLRGQGLWLRQSGESGQTVIRASRANADATILYDVNFITYAENNGPARRILAQSAQLHKGAWVLQNAKTWSLILGQNPEEDSAYFKTLEIPSTLTQESIRDSFGKPSTVSIWDLPGFITRLNDAGFSSRRHTVWFHMELARPLFLIAMVLVGAAFTMRHNRFGRTGTAVLSAVLLGFGLYYVRNLAQILGENGQLDPILAAWTPPFASLFLAFGLLLHMEDG